MPYVGVRWGGLDWPNCSFPVKCQMLLFLLSFSLSVFFLCANFPLGMRFHLRFHPLPWKDFSFFLNRIAFTLSLLLPPSMFPRKKPQIVPQEKPLVIPMPSSPSLLDLPDLVLECILHKLPPEALCRMAAACTSLRDVCAADHLWERHLHHKWGRIIGPNARREWRIHAAAFGKGKGKGNGKGNGTVCGEGGLADYLIRLWPLALIRSGLSSDNNTGKRNFPPADSVMSWYIALETGSFWVPAQVYNRENGHFGFVLSCYDAELSYDRHTNTFQARYPPHGRRICAIESGVTWDRLRAPPVNTPPHDLHISDCLDELRPGDPIEIQWRRNREFPYGWWYGVVGHLETCDGNTFYCRCSDKDTLVLEFNQYTRGSRWRTTTVNRKDHREEGNETDGFYGGIRKLSCNKEVSMWEKLWPSQALE